jgi:glycine cleavage system H protein
MTKYSKNNVYVRKEKNIAYLGVSDIFVEDSMSKIEFVELPKVGEILSEDTLCIIETIDDTFEFPSPVSGEIIEVNNEIDNEPNIINRDSEYSGWICKIKLTDKSEFEALMTLDAYKDYWDKNSTDEDY